MKKFRSALIGVDQGVEPLFNDFEHGGEMWTGEGPRERRVRVKFSEPFRTPPAVMVALSLWDTDASVNQRIDLKAERIGRKGFTIRFTTWGDSRIARVHAAWMAIGELEDEELWDV